MVSMICSFLLLWFCALRTKYVGGIKLDILHHPYARIIFHTPDGFHYLIDGTQFSLYDANKVAIDDSRGIVIDAGHGAYQPTLRLLKFVWGDFPLLHGGDLLLDN